MMIEIMELKKKKYKPIVIYNCHVNYGWSVVKEQTYTQIHLNYYSLMFLHFPFKKNNKEKTQWNHVLFFEFTL